MSLKLTKQVWEHSELNGSDKLMLLALADHADDDGFCWPSYVTLAELTGTNPGPKNDCRQAKRTMNNLRQSGELLIWEQQGQHGGRGYTNLYLIITGLSEQEILEIVTRRFELTADEVSSVISKKGDIYTTLSHLKRVTYETLLRTRETKKGGIDDEKSTERVVSKAEKGGMDTTRTVIESVNSPNGEGDKSPPISVKSKKLKMDKAKEPADIPASIKVYQSIARRLPDKVLWPDIAAKVGDAPEDLERWGNTVKAYISCGWNKLNLSGMLNFFEQGRIPTTQPVKNGAGNKDSPYPTTKTKLTPKQQAQYEKLKQGAT